jgi:GNAT superfamily N-acetyltransferase
MDIRPIGTEDISWCQQVFDASFNDLHRRYGLQDEEPSERAEWLRPILTHLLETDPSGSLGATVTGEPVAFASSFRRDDYWFLSFLFVHPSAQGKGIGRNLLDELAPPEPHVVRATVVESFQPVSTGLYARRGMVPRSIKYWLNGVSRPGSLPSLADDVRRTALTEEDVADIDDMDRAVLGFERPAEHRWWSRTLTRGWSYRRGSTLVAYVYVDNDYVGPALAVDEQTLCAVVADIIGTAERPASMSVNLCADSSALFRMLLDAGARIDDSAPYRYVYCSSRGSLPSSYIQNADWLP